MKSKDIVSNFAGSTLGWLLVKTLGDQKYTFKGKTVLITGGTRGLGLVLARQLAAEGANLVLVARDEAELNGAGDELTLRRNPVLVRPCDITSPPQIERVVHEAHARFGHVDVLINNAGVHQVGPAECMGESDFEESLQTHFWGPYHMIQALLPDLIRCQGRIVNISSIGGKVSLPHLLPYSTGKFALTGYSEGITAELAMKGVKVTTVCPGLMRTGSPRAAIYKAKNHWGYETIEGLDSLPLISVSAEKAARRIIEACRSGKREIFVSRFASLATRLHGALPEITMPLLDLANRFLPEAGPLESQIARGKSTDSIKVSHAILNRLSARALERAARRHGEGEKPRHAL